MLRGLMNLLSLCWKPFGRGGENLSSVGVIGTNCGGKDSKDSLLWFYDYGKYASGDFSMAVVQANQVLEDQSQIESGPFGTFVGIYDGHGGPDAARYVCNNLFRRFRGSSFSTPLLFCNSCLLYLLMSYDDDDSSSSPLVFNGSVYLLTWM